MDQMDDISLLVEEGNVNCVAHSDRVNPFRSGQQQSFAWLKGGTTNEAAQTRQRSRGDQSIFDEHSSARVIERSHGFVPHYDLPFMFARHSVIAR